MPDISNFLSLPNIVTQRWLPPELAIRRVVHFERFGKDHLALASHCALPSLLTPELVNLIRVNFLAEKTPWVAETDLLLSNLCIRRENGLYEVEPRIREVLLAELKHTRTQQEILSLAQFLYAYTYNKGAKLSPHVQSVYYRIANAYLQPHALIQDAIKDLRQSVERGEEALANTSNQIQIIDTLELLRGPLEQSGLQREMGELYQSTRILAYYLYGNASQLRRDVLTYTENNVDENEDAFPLLRSVLDWIIAIDISPDDSSSLTLPLKICLCSAPGDEKLRKDLENCLKVLQRKFFFETWSPSDIRAGQDKKREINEKLNEADIILFLLSSEFIASEDFHDQAELAIQQHIRREAIVIPVLLTACHWKETLLGRLKPLPKNGEPVTSWPDKDEALFEIADELISLAKQPILATELPTLANAASISLEQREPPVALLEEESAYVAAQTFLDPKMPIACVLFTSDGEKLISDSWEHTIKYRDIRTGTTQNLIKYSGLLKCLALSNDGILLSGGGDERVIHLWEFHSGKRIASFTGHQGAISCLAFTPDGRLVSGSDDGTLRVWNIDTRASLMTLQGHQGPVTSLAISPDGSLASGGYDTTIKFWNTDGSVALTLTGHQGPVSSVAFSPTRRMLVSGSHDKTIKIWDLDTRQVKRTLVGHKGPVTSVALSPDGRILISGSYDKTIKVWDYATDQCMGTLTGHTEEVMCLAFHPTENIFASGSLDKTARIWKGPSESLDMATTLNDQAHQYIEQGSYAEAETFYQRALEIRERLLGNNHPDTATSLNNLADLYRVLARYADAETFYWRALVIRERLLGDNHPDTATNLNNLADLYRVLARYADAKPLYQRALAIRKRRLGDDHPDTATSLNNLAELYQAQGKYADAEPLYQDARNIREQQLGADHPDTATSLNNLAELYQAQGKYADAEPLYQRTLAIREQRLGSLHPDTATSLSNLASLYQNQSRYAEAEPLYKQALSIYHKVFGADHPSTATTWHEMARLYQAQKRYDEAEPLYQRSLKIYQQVLGPEHPSTGIILHALASLHQVQEQYDQAESLYQKALRISETSEGREHPSTGNTLHALARLYQTRGRSHEAKSLYERALHISEQTFGDQHPYTETIRKDLAELNRAQGNDAKAKSLLERSSDVDEQVPIHEHPDTTTNLNNLTPQHDEITTKRYEPYSRTFSRQYPGLFVILLDQSESMAQRDKNGISKADLVTLYVNHIIQKMIEQAPVDEFSGRLKNYAYLSILGYNNTVYPLLSSPAPMSIPDLDEYPYETASNMKLLRNKRTGQIKRIEEKRRIWIKSYAAPYSSPKEVLRSFIDGEPLLDSSGEPILASSRDMTLAFEEAERVISGWLASPPEPIEQAPDGRMQSPRSESFPPILINITDAKYTGERDPDEVIERIRKMGTNDGKVLVYNCHFTHEGVTPCVFPATPDELRQYTHERLTERLFRVSSPMPDTLRDGAQKQMRKPISPGARCFIYNADPDILVRLLRWGTLGNRNARREGEA